MGKGELEPSLSCVEREVRVVVLARVLCGSGEENGLVVVRMGRWWENADRAGTRGVAWGGKGELGPSLSCEDREVRGGGAGASAVWERGGEWAGRGSDGEGGENADRAGAREWGRGERELTRTVFILRGERGACGGAGASAVWERGREWAGRGSDGGRGGGEMLIEQ